VSLKKINHHEPGPKSTKKIVYIPAIVFDLGPDNTHDTFENGCQSTSTINRKHLHGGI